MVKFETTTVFFLVAFLVAAGLIAFFALPSEVPASRRLSAERIVRLQEVPRISFAEPEEDSGLVNVEVIACPDGRIIPITEQCSEFLEEEPLNCDASIEDPVCGADGSTFLSDCFATIAGVEFVPGMCEETFIEIIDTFNATNATVDDAIDAGVPIICSVEVAIENGTISDSLLYLQGKDFRFAGIYESEAGLAPIDLAQSEQKLYIYNPEENVWYVVDAEVGAFDLPFIRRKFGSKRSLRLSESDCTPASFSIKRFLRGSSTRPATIESLLAMASSSGGEIGASITPVSSPSPQRIKPLPTQPTVPTLPRPS